MNWCFASINNQLAEMYFEEKTRGVYLLHPTGVQSIVLKTPLEIFFKMTIMKESMNLLSIVSKTLPIKPVYAHCDIPCGIYEPHTSQVAAHTVLRMTKLIQAAGGDMHKIARLTKVKEEHAEILKREVSILWSDYFKSEHLEKFPELHTQVWNILKLASKTKQEIDGESAAKLLEEIQKFAEVFYQSKGLEPIRIPSGFPTEGEIVTHK